MNNCESNKPGNLFLPPTDEKMRIEVQVHRLCKPHNLSLTRYGSIISGPSHLTARSPQIAMILHRVFISGADTIFLLSLLLLLLSLVL